MRHILLIILLGSLLSTELNGQKLPPYELGGASKPSPQLSIKNNVAYKRVHQFALRMLLRDEPIKARNILNLHLEQNPGDAESLFMLGLFHAQQGDLEQAEASMKSSLDAGLPPGRLIAGPRSMFEPICETELLQSIHDRFTNELVHGPMLGNVTDQKASFWGRTAAECEIEILVSVTGSEQEVATSPVVNSTANDDFTFVASVEGLKPNTEYIYQIRLNGKLLAKKYQFKTFGPQGQPSTFSFAFGGGAGFVPENERMWNTIGESHPDAILLLGDNVYIDDPESLEMQRYTYYRRQSRPEWRKLIQSHPVFTIWDDHDFSTNDSRGGADIDIPFWKKDWVYPTFRQNWVNPGYAGGDEQPGCWYSFSIADVDFIMLDCRYYRTHPKKSPRSMLGPVQLDWLKKKLSSSEAKLKIICSSVPWDFRTKGDSLDTWNGYQEERNEIFDYIESSKIEGILLVSADRHRSDCWKISRPKGYDFYEFNSSRLTNQHVHPRMEKAGAIFSFNQSQSFGLVTIDTTQDDPLIRYEVIDIEGNRPHQIEVRHSKLRFDTEPNEK